MLLREKSLKILIGYEKLVQLLGDIPLKIMFFSSFLCNTNETIEAPFYEGTLMELLKSVVVFGFTSKIACQILIFNTFEVVHLCSSLVQMLQVMQLF